MLKIHTINALTLFTSMSTLVCCALPALFVALGAGAALAGIVTAVPQLIWFSEHKLWVFGAAGILLSLSGLMRYLNRNAPCPIDPEKASACKTLRKLSFVIYSVSLVIYATGVFFAFVAPALMS